MEIWCLYQIIFLGTPIEAIYEITNGGFLFTLVMVVLQMTLPFYIPYFIIKQIQNIKDKKEQEKQSDSNIENEILLKEKYEVKR